MQSGFIYLIGMPLKYMQADATFGQKIALHSISKY